MTSAAPAWPKDFWHPNAAMKGVTPVAGSPTPEYLPTCRPGHDQDRPKDIDGGQSMPDSLGATVHHPGYELSEAGIVPKASVDMFGSDAAFMRFRSSSILPFESPSDRSLDSPASARDLATPTLSELELCSGRPLISPLDHGTQASEDENANYLEGINLFSDEWPQELPQAGITPTVAGSNALGIDVAAHLPLKAHSSESEPFAVQFGGKDLSFDAQLDMVRAGDGCAQHAPAPDAVPAPRASDPQDPAADKVASMLHDFVRTHGLDDFCLLVESLARSGVSVAPHVIEEIVNSHVESQGNYVDHSEAASKDVDDAAHVQPTLPGTDIHSGAAKGNAFMITTGSSGSPMTQESPLGAFGPSYSPFAYAGPTMQHTPCYKSNQDQLRARGAENVTSHKVQSSLQEMHSPRLQALGVRDAIDAIKANQAHYVTVNSRQGKRFACAVCGKPFDRLFNLRSHAKTHVPPEERDMPFYCPVESCGRGFVRKHDTLRHYRTVHVKRGEIVSEHTLARATSGRGRADSMEMHCVDAADHANG